MKSIEEWLRVAPLTGKGLPHKIYADGKIIAGFPTRAEAEAALAMYKNLQGRDPSKDKKVHQYTWELK